MKRASLTLLAALVWLAPAFAQNPPFPPSMPPNTVVGNPLPVAAPGQSIPLAVLGSKLGYTGEQPVSDANYSFVSSDPSGQIRTLVYTALTASRTVTLSPAANYPPGVVITLMDRSGAASPTVVLNVAPTGSDTINGVNANATVIAGPYASVSLETDGISKWTVRQSPLLGLSNRWRGDQYFGSGRPWVDARSTANGTCAAALGNGSDDQPALQCQANYLNTTFVGGTLYVPCGNYHLASTLTIPNGVHLVGAGWTCTALTVTTDTTVIASTAANQTIAVSNITISGYQNSAATQNAVVIGDSGTLADFTDVYIAGGFWAVEQHGTDGNWVNVQIYGFGASGGGILSFGANWYDHVKIDQGSVATSAAFTQGPTSFVAENHFLNSDFSGSYTDSVVINDTTGTHAITYFSNSVFSSPIVVTNAAVTVFTGAEFGSNITANSGTVIVSASAGISTTATVSGSASHIVCGINQSVTCPTSLSPTGGSNTQVQYNNSGALGGISGVVSNGSGITVTNGNFALAGSSSGSSTVNAPASGGGTVTFFTGTDTVVGAAATQTLTNKTISASSNTLTNIPNSALTNSATTVAGQTCTLGSTCLSTQASQMALAPGLMVIGHITGVNFNSANTDNAISITLPTGFTRYNGLQFWITNASASLTTATFGVFTATGGGGTTILTAGQAITVSSASDGVNNNSQLSQPATANTQSFTVAGFPTLYFRVGTAEGSTATGDVTIYGRPYP